MDKEQRPYAARVVQRLPAIVVMGVLLAAISQVAGFSHAAPPIAVAGVVSLLAWAYITQ